MREAATAGCTINAGYRIDAKWRSPTEWKMMKLTGAMMRDAPFCWLRLFRRRILGLNVTNLNIRRLEISLVLQYIVYA